MKATAFLSALLALVPLCQGHMEMSWPPPFRSRHNPFTTNIDYNLIDPLRDDGSNFPCKGYHSLMGTPQGQPVVTWEPGRNYNFSIIGTATHDGGSCQASLSYDHGLTWTVIQSYHGGCPLSRDWQFTLPQDTPPGDALFAWSWFNRIGNREMYMNCARITIRSSARALPVPQERVGNDSQLAGISARTPHAFSSRPHMFVANVNNGCSTLERFDVVFPNPGPNVHGVSERPAAPVGNCGGGPAVSSLSTTTIIVPTTSSSIPPRPDSTSTSTSSASATGSPSGFAKIWEQCGGNSWTGPRECEPGLECWRQSEWYSQCIPQTESSSLEQPVPGTSSLTTISASSTMEVRPTTTSTAIGPPPLSTVWQQCGGVDWNGPTACAPGLVCNRQSEWYSQCIPSAHRV